jgi:catechol 2,3-dioxygenase-like lactoylglutathione lyase family enzyme
MTTTMGVKAPNRRDRGLGIHSIGEFVLAVPRLAEAERFYRSFGLDVGSADGLLELRTEGDGYRWGRVMEGPRKAIHHIAFHCFAEDLDGFKRHIESEGVQVLSPPPGFASNGLWFRDQDGMTVEIRPGVKTSPDRKTPADYEPTEAGKRNAPYRRKAQATRPRRLSHILRFTTDVSRAVAFYGRVLGLRLSDRSGDLVAFMHGIHGSDHHLMAFAKSEAPGLHHLSWDVPSIDAVGLGAMTMADKGYKQGWGTGRHVLGSNYFHYIRDPWGSFCEYSCDIDFVPASMDWEGIDHPAEDSFYLWGPDVPPEFLLNTEAHPER